MDMDTYIGKIESTPPKRTDPDERPLTPRETTDFRSLLMKLAWPVRQVLPELAYGVSFLATRVTTATVGDQKKLHGLVVEAKNIIQEGGGKIRFYKIDMDKLAVVTSLDASFAKEEGLKSQAGFCSMLCSLDVLKTHTQ